MDDGYEKILRIVSKKHDLVSIVLEDPREKDLLKAGLIKFKDAETGRTRYIDTSNKSVQEYFKQKINERKNIQNEIFLKSRVDTVNIDISTSYVKPLINFFKLRVKR
jgi:hypothetical protein